MSKSGYFSVTASGCACMYRSWRSVTRPRSVSVARVAHPSQAGARASRRHIKHGECKGYEEDKGSTSITKHPARSGSQTGVLDNPRLRGRDTSLGDPSSSVWSNSAVQTYYNAVCSWTDSFPARYKIVAACCLSFVICNMDKVNMSVAIIPMAQEFGWTPGVAGLVQSSFFWGYMFAQIPAGYLANRFSGRFLLPTGVGTWSAFTAAVPLLSGTIPSLCLSRAFVGLGEGVAPSAVNDMVAKAVPSRERARSVATIFGGLHIGSILGLLVAPGLIDRFGWQSVFYVFGALGLVWVAGFEGMVRQQGDATAELRRLLRPDASDEKTGRPSAIPWRAFLRNRPVQALMFTHFCNNWFHYTMLAWLPTYFTQTLSLDLAHASQVSLFPSIAGFLVSTVAGQVADRLVESGMKVAHVRKLAQSTAFLVPAMCLLATCSLQGSDWCILFVSGALGLNSFALSGLYCTHQDMSPRFAGPLLGLTNTSGAVPGIIGVAVVGLLLEQTGSWELALFAPIITFFILGTIVYVAFSRSELQDFSNNEPFEWESRLRSLPGGSER